jgi:integrase
VHTKIQSENTDHAHGVIAAHGNPAAAYLAQLGPGSRRTMREAVSKLARLASDGAYTADTLPWHELRIEQTTALRTRLASELAPATANKHLAALRGVLKQCWRLGSISVDDYQRAIDLPAVHGPSPRKHRTLSPQELLGLVAVCESDRSPAGARDAALFALLFGAGLRRSEVVALDVSSFDVETGILTLEATASRPQRRLTVNREGRRALEHWLGQRGSLDGPLFNPINKGGRIEVRRLSEQAIYIACHKRAAEAGLPPVSPEDLRRSLHASKPRAMRRAAGARDGLVVQSA